MHSKSTNKMGWTIFGMGNFINDIIDAIYANNENVSRIITNQPVNKKLIAQYKISIDSIDNFTPNKNEKYIFGFLNPNKIPLLAEISKYKLHFSNLIHPKAYLAKNTQLGEGNYFGPGVILGPNTRVGNYNYFNRGSLVGHDVEVGSFNHFGPGSIVCGRCKIADRCNFGAGTVVNDGLAICSDCTTGSLAGVTKDISFTGTYVGLPAKKLP